MKPYAGMSWLEVCPKCGNNKAIWTAYKNYQKYKCTKCKYVWEKKGGFKK